MNKQRCAKELYYWLYGTNPTNFTSKLYELISKADGQNRYAISRGFPNEVAIWQEWQDSPDEKEFFKKYGVPEGAPTEKEPA